MTSTQLVPLGNLKSLSDKQKEEYLRQVCEHFEIPVHLNLLEYIDLEAGDGAKHMVLYAKKGATDMLREKHGISIVELHQTITSQAAIFTAKAQDKNGRTEIAVGASSIEGLIGRELANQIMIAQTRATRRVTLQFVGGGFLDESEVFQSQTTNINSLATALAPVSEAVSSIAKQPTQPTVNATAPKEGRTKEQIDAQEALDKMTKTSRLRRHTPTFSLQEAGVDTAHPPSYQPNAVPEKGAVVPETSTLALKIEESDNVPCDADIKPAIKAETVLSEIAATVQAVQEVSGQNEPAIKVAISADIPTDEQMKAFKTRLRVFTDEVFPQAGMVPSEGLGGVTMKVRLYAMARYKVMDLKKLTVTQWNELFNYFDKTDAKIVVSEIEETISK